MKFSKMMKLEIWKLFYSKIIWISVIIEIVSIVLSQVNAEEVLKLKDVIISPYIGISLTFRYMYMAYIVSNLFSKDVEDQIIDTYVAIGYKKSIIWSVKEIYVILVGSFNTVFSAFIYFALAIIVNGNPGNTVMVAFWISVLCTIVPLIIHLLLLTVIDIFSNSFACTILISVAMIISSGLFSYDISKWIYISYNNPYLIFLSHDKIEIERMFFVYCIEANIFLIANWLAFRKSRR